MFVQLCDFFSAVSKFRLFAADASIKLTVFCCASVMAGCTTSGQVTNQPILNVTSTKIASGTLFEAARTLDPEGLTVILAFSGGGTRASALSYGILEELRDTTVELNGQSVRLLDEVDFISAVSGGSFTAAYYGLFREQIFVDFKQKVLTRDFTQQLIHSLMNPLMWLSSLGITDRASGMYADAGFGQHTFGDMLKNGPPFIAINATDLTKGTRFTFIQDYFSLICSDINSYPVAHGVAASAAVPVIFNPVVIRNYDNCDLADSSEFLNRAENRGRLTVRDSARAGSSYALKEERPYVHLVDGGISDNLGLRLISETIEMSGGMHAYLNKAFGNRPFQVPRHYVIISVNASVKADTDIDSKKTPPSITQTINAVTDAQLHQYNNETIELIQSQMKRWEREMSTPDRPVHSHFIALELKSVVPDSLKDRINLIPTSLGLPKVEVELLIKTGRELLRNNAEFQTLLNMIKEESGR